jgi:hypothetical protein
MEAFGELLGDEREFSITRVGHQRILAMKITGHTNRLIEDMGWGAMM